MESITGLHIRNKSNTPPRITIQPPDDYSNIAKSMPDISLSDNNNSHHYYNNNNIDDNIDNVPSNFSSNSDISIDECDDNFIVYEQIIKKRSYSESISSSSNFNQSSRQQDVPSHTSNVHHYNKNNQKINTTLPCHKKKDISPSDVLKHKLKSSLSLHNLNPSKNNQNYDKYHTVHGNCSKESSSSYLSSSSSSLPSTVSSSICSSNNNKSNVFHINTNIKRSYNNKNNNKFDYVTTEDLTTSTTTRTRASLLTNQYQYNHVKCCCGNINCATVVPLQEYLETYFTKMVRLFIIV